MTHDFKCKKAKLQLNNLKSGIKIAIQLTLNLSSNVIGKFNEESNF